MFSAAALLAVVIFTACSSDPEAAETGPTTPTPEVSTAPVTQPSVSFASQIQPIIEGSCARCHTAGGPGTTHLVLDTAQDVADESTTIAFVAEVGYMPPWPASPASVDFQHDWSLNPVQIATLVEWAAEGGPIDVAPDTKLVPTAGVQRLADDADLVVRSTGAYQGSADAIDEYQCLRYDPALAEPRSATALEFIPDQTEVVHHAIVFVLDESDRDDVEAKDAATPEAGWPCTEFRPGSTAQVLFAWAPGQGPVEYGDGVGVELQPGSFFVVQTHYHYDGSNPTDQSSLAMQWAEGESIAPITLTQYVGPAEIPCGPDEQGPLCDRDAAVERERAEGAVVVQADMILASCDQTAEEVGRLVDGIARSSCDQVVRAPGRIVSVFGHLHELGASIRLTINPDSADEIVLLDIPQWNFDWQLNYRPVDDIVLRDGDMIRIECSWDRAKRDASLEPAYVLWSEGTDDEMCYSTITTTPPPG